MIEVTMVPGEKRPDKRPRISLITPSYNQAPFLDHAIRSVVNQGYPNLEYIIIDGGSSDGSVEIIRRYESKLSCWTSERDRGPYEALNKGFSMAAGEIMGWLNADDILMPGALENLAEIFTLFPDIEWVTGRPSFLDEQGRLIDAGHVVYTRRLEYLCGSHLLQQESTYWRRSLWERSGGYIADTVAFDFELWLRFFRHARLYPLRTILAAFRYSDLQLSRIHAREYRQEMGRLIAQELAEGGLLAMRYRIWRYCRYLFRMIRPFRIFEMGPYPLLGCPQAIYYDRESKRFVNPNR